MGRKFCSSDWHGCLNPALKLLDYLEPNDTLYFLGDVIDRGDHGAALLNILLSDPRVKMINGNHEMMMIETLSKALKTDIRDEDIFYDILYSSLWFQNGGIYTWENNLENKTRAELKEIVNKLSNLKSNIVYKSPNGHTVFMEHAGHTITDTPYYTHDPYWDRSHFNDNWGGKDNEYIIHGHTPVQYLKFSYGYKDQPPLTKEEQLIKYDWYKSEINYDPEVIQYCDGHKFDIDLCTIVSDKVALIDLDTFEIKYFGGN